MKKILSLLLCLSMVATMMLSSTVYAALDEETTIITDVSVMEAASFKNFVGEGFDENYFFMATFVMPANSQHEYDTVKSTKIKFVLEDNDEENELDCYIAWYPYLESQNIGCMGVMDTSNTTTYVKTELKTGEEVVMAENNSLSDLYYGSLNDGTSKTKTTYGVALKDYTQLKKNTTVTMKIVSVDAEGNETVVETASKEFTAPVSFESEELADLAAVLSAIDNGETVEADAIKNALAKVSSEEAKSELIAATKVAEGETEAKISDEAIKALVSALANDVTVTTTNTSTDRVKVSMPNAALAAGEDVEIAVTDAENIDGVTVGDGKTSLSLDISIKKGGTEIQPLFPQTVEIELPAYFAKDEGKKVTIYHKTANESKEVEIIDNKISFVTDSFSVFTLVGDEIVITEDNLAEEVKVVIERRTDANGEDTNTFDIGIAPSGIYASEKAIVNFVDATFGLRITGVNTADVNAMVSCDYTLTGADGIVIDGINNNESVGANTLVDINFLAQVPGGKEGTASITKGLGEILPIAVLELNSIGAANLEVGGIDLGNTGSSSNVIYTEVGQNRATATPLYQSQKLFTIEQKKHNIDIEIEFANALADAKLADTDYLGMTVVFRNALTGDTQTAVVGNGTDADVNYLTISKAIGADGLKVSTAIGSVELIADNSYTFEVKGAGFRTVRGSVLADKDKTITLWNNARTANSEEVVEGDGNPVYKNFLVGDIYMDGIVDIYDLSAVTSYYAPKKAVTENKYATYDLNRDGYIDAADIAYVQVSYGN